MSISTAKIKVKEINKFSCLKVDQSPLHSSQYLTLFLSSGHVSGFNTSKSVNRLSIDYYTLYILSHPPQFGFDVVKQRALFIGNTCNDLQSAYTSYFVIILLNRALSTYVMLSETLFASFSVDFLSIIQQVEAFSD